MNDITFGKYIKSKRLSLGIRLNDFCKKGFNATYISQMERGEVKPFKDEFKIRKLGTMLRFDNTEISFLIDLANVENKKISADFLPEFKKIVFEKWKNKLVGRKT